MIQRQEHRTMSYKYRKVIYLLTDITFHKKEYKLIFNFIRYSEDYNICCGSDGGIEVDIAPEQYERYHTLFTSDLSKTANGRMEILHTILDECEETLQTYIMKEADSFLEKYKD